MDPKKNTELIRTKALELGFSFCGFAKADFLHEEEKGLHDWLKKGFQGNMSWLEKNVDLRLDPRKLEPWSRSVVCLMLNYFPSQTQESSASPRISKYAWGRDYHKVVRKKLKAMTDFISVKIGDVQTRGFVDSGPVMERAWARRAGLGWIGKNSLTLVKRGGSFYFLAVLLTDLDLVYDKPNTLNYCGSCTLCIEACPTQAIVKPGVIDSRRCISYLTIEHKDNIGDEFMGKMQNWAFGCDVCQDVCPHNKRYSVAHQEPEFLPRIDWGSMNDEEWKELSRDTFNKLFQGTPVMRAGFEGFTKNLRFLKRQ